MKRILITLLTFYTVSTFAQVDNSKTHYLLADIWKLTTLMILETLTIIIARGLLTHLIGITK